MGHGNHKHREHRRITREKKTIAAMVRMYCKALHKGPDVLCPECAEFLSYAHHRLERCRYQERKPTCGNCPVHCYKPGMKDRAIEVMRWSGPRMTLRHPWYALLHLLDGFRKPPSRKKTGTPA